MLCAMPVTARIDGLGELLERQFSVASRGQLLGLGMKDNAMRWRVRAGGPWQALLPGVYLSLTGAPNPPQKEMAALLYAGPGSLITGRGGGRDSVGGRGGSAGSHPGRAAAGAAVQRVAVHRRPVSRPSGRMVAGCWCGGRG